MQKAVQTKDDENERQQISRDGRKNLHKVLLFAASSVGNDAAAPGCRTAPANNVVGESYRPVTIEVNYIDINIIDYGIIRALDWLKPDEFRATSMKKDTPTAVHAWLVMMKAMQAITRYGLANLEETGLGLSDFAVLEALLHKGPLPVNVIGPKVNLTPGSISVAVDRLVAKGLVSRAECSQDRRVRIVALTPRGKSVITPIFRAMRRRWRKCLPAFRTRTATTRTAIEARGKTSGIAIRPERCKRSHGKERRLSLAAPVSFSRWFGKSNRFFLLALIPAAPPGPIGHP